MASGFSILTGTLDQSRWVPEIYDLLRQNGLAAASQTPVSVFRLPQSVRDGDPAAYLPRRIAIGPYHHFLPELYAMDLFKLGKAKNLKLDSQIHKLANQPKPLELKIRACFDQSLQIDGETLLWVVLIDGLFLIDLLQSKYSNRPLKLPLEIFYGKLWSEFEIVSDMVKLENQIPLFVLKEICPEQPIKYLAPLLYQFSASVSPFELPSFNPEFHCFGFSSNFTEIFDLSQHLLHLLYFLVLLIPNEMAVSTLHGKSMHIAMDASSYSSSGDFLSESLSILGSVINIAFIQQAKETIGLLQRLFKLLGSITKPSLAEKKTPLIPSASDLKTAGVTFRSTKNGILKCRFNQRTLTFTLPSIHLDGFSQVLLKNLVAFEAMAELNPPCLANYIALMNGLLRNSKDLKILEEAQIVHNHLNKEEAVELFNGVENSTSSLKKQSVVNIHLKSGLDLEIGSKFIQDIKKNYDFGLGPMAEEINNYYESCWRTKMKKFVSVVFSCFAILVIVFLIVLVIARFVCNYVSCPKGIFKTSIALHQMY